jgi:hypothetical protein
MGGRPWKRRRVKRTFNLTEGTIEGIRTLALLHDVADSQDGVVELAIQELRRQVTDREEALLWERASAGIESPGGEAWPGDARPGNAWAGEAWPNEPD